MAAPSKIGLDYFPFDVDFFQDEKIQFISIRFGLKGELIVIRLLCKIYRQGYYMSWNNDIALLFAKSVGDNCQHTFVNDVVNELLKRGFFNRSIFERFSILTSKGIQNRYFEASSKRKGVSYDSRILLVDLSKYSNTQQINDTNLINNRVNVDINETNIDINGVNVDINPQSKVKESKVKESKGKKIDCTESEQAASMPPPIITLTLNDKTEYPIYQKDIDYWVSLYSAVNIVQELKKMKGWCDANHGKRKTKRGIKRFINAWLAKEQDKGGHYGKVNGNRKQDTDKSAEYEDSIARAVKRGCTFETSEYDF